ncbi:MAG: pyridoxamine 5'-phosphate oxidase family protein [Sulfobacillus thermotolerans]|nr:pyridoxamine 5'-phosphate oxidase family protein [Sulfobacillus thermotolerans]
MDPNISSRIRVHRHSERGYYDFNTIYSIMDEALYCHIAVIRDGVPVVLPTLHVRIEDQVYFHGAVAAGIFKDLKEEAHATLSVTLLDGLVLARSAYNHSLNYRSVVVMGTPYEVTDVRHKTSVLEAMVEHVMPGRWNDCRRPTDVEIKTTRVFGMPLTEASAKIRSGPPLDDVSDLSLPFWAGVVNMKQLAVECVQDPQQSPDITAPPYLPAK